MRGFGAFLRKEFTEIVRTWRIWVLPGILLFFGVTSPILAQATPALLKSLGTGDSGIVIQLPTPTALDAYAQFLKNLTQVTSFAIIIALAGVVSAETRGGTSILVLTKPVSRGAFVVAKAISNAVLLLVSTVVAALACAGITSVLFDAGDTQAFFTGVGLWLAFGLVLVAVMVFISSVMDSQAGASAIGLGVFFAVSIAALWGPAREFTLVGLLPMAGDAMAGKPIEPLWPLVTAALACIAFVGAGAWAYRGREL